MAGEITAHTVGSAMIIATSEGRADTLALSVLPAAVARVAFTAAAPRLLTGDTITLKSPKGAVLDTCTYKDRSTKDDIKSAAC